MHICRLFLRAVITCFIYFTLLGFFNAHNVFGDSVSVTVINPSFEANDAGDVLTTVAPSWNNTDGLSTFDPRDAQFLNTTGDNVQGELPHGGQVGNLDLGRVLSQNLGVTSIAGATYTLDFFAGGRRDRADGPYRVELLEGGVPIIDSNQPAPADGWTPVQLTGVATGGQPLTLRYINISGQSFVDQVSLSASLAGLEVINVPDANFSTDNPGDVGTAAPSVWTGTGIATTTGIFDPGSAQFAGTTGDNVQGILPSADGQVGNIGFGTGTLEQNLGVMASPNDTFVLSVAVGNRLQTNIQPNYRLELLVDGVPFASVDNPVMPTDGQWEIAELIGSPDVAGELGIRFSNFDIPGGNTEQVFFDNVVLYRTTAAVPEPFSLVSFLAALAVMCVYRRRTRKT